MKRAWAKGVSMTGGRDGRGPEGRHPYRWDVRVLSNVLLVLFVSESPSRNVGVEVFPGGRGWQCTTWWGAQIQWSVRQEQAMDLRRVTFRVKDDSVVGVISPDRPAAGILIIKLPDISENENSSSVADG